jgi:hypothetical protein
MTPNDKNKNTNKYPSETEPKKDRPGTDPKNPTNADYDYRADRGDTGGGVDHNPESNDQLVSENEKQSPQQQRK